MCGGFWTGVYGYSGGTEATAKEKSLVYDSIFVAECTEIGPD